MKWIPALFCVLWFAAGPEQLAINAQPGTKRVLLLHQFGVNRPARVPFDFAFFNALRSPGVDLYVETVDIERFPGGESARLDVNYLRRKYADHKIDVIVTFGSLGLAFAREHRNIFGNPPIVACVTVGEINRNNDETGLEIEPTYSRTLDLALMLRPNTQTVYVVDSARGNPGDRETGFRRQFNEHRGSIELVYFRDLPLSELLPRVAAIPEHSIVIYLNQTMLDRSQELDQFEGLSRVVGSSPVPVFSLNEQFLGRGITGGYVWEITATAERLAKMARRIADGVSARDIPVGLVTYHNVVDWRELRRWEIPESRVPPGTTVLFRPESFFQLYWRYIVGIATVFGIQMFLIVGLLIERTWRRRAEREAQQTRENLAHVARLSTMGQLAASLAHELNQPLGSMLYNARAGSQMLSANKYSKLELKEIFDDIATDNIRARDVIARVRALVSKRLVQSAPVDVNKLIHTVRGLVRGDATRRRVSVDLDLAPMLLVVNGDEIQLQQVVLNLLINAIEAVAEARHAQRKVVVKTDLKDAQTVHVLVRDTGPGLQTGAERQVFEPFYTTKPSGMGMGLSIARSIIESHGGSIWAERPADGGAAFHFTLPQVVRGAGGFDA